MYLQIIGALSHAKKTPAKKFKLHEILKRFE